MDECFHVVEIALKGSTARPSKAVFRLGHAPLEGLVAGDILRVFELARVHADIAVGCVEQLFEIAESERLVDGERADDAEPHALVDQPVEAGSAGRFPPADALGTTGCGKGVRSSHHASSRLPGRTERAGRQSPRPYRSWPTPPGRTARRRRTA